MVQYTVARFYGSRCMLSSESSVPFCKTSWQPSWPRGSCHVLCVVNSDWPLA